MTSTPTPPLRRPAAALLAAASLLVAFPLSPAARAAGLLDQPMAPEPFQACVQQLASQTGQAGRPLRHDDFVRIASGARYDDRVRQALLVTAGEPSFWWDELAATTDDQRVAEGRAVLARGGETLRQIEARFGVPREIVVAIYGIETNYGPAAGRIPVLDAALSLACLRPCADPAGACAARERAFAAVRLLRDGKVRPEAFQGSWAAAFGRTQFVPDTYEQLAVDFDGDGLADVVGSEPDAWASTANHLRRRGGWLPGVPVYLEVRIPADQEAAYRTGGQTVRVPAQSRKASEWAAAGWKAVAADGSLRPLALPGDPDLHAFLPVGLPGPAFLASRNFNTVFRYNNSARYVLEVALLADRIAGGPGIVTPWPTDDPGLSRAQVRELQAWLAARGHALVQADGVMGRNTRDAIEAEFLRKGLPAQRRVGQRTLAVLMQP